MRSADGGELIRRLLATILQLLVAAEATLLSVPNRISEGHDVGVPQYLGRLGARRMSAGSTTSTTLVISLPQPSSPGSTRTNSGASYAPNGSSCEGCPADRVPLLLGRCGWGAV